MRVISGTAKGHNLKCIKGNSTRPTTDMVKESIFNIIVNFINGSVVLDIFSGTGSLCIEALSRGAQYGIMIDNNSECIKTIKQNLEHTKLVDKADVIFGDTKKLHKLDYKFDLIFMDPPYNKGLIIPTLNIIHEKDLLKTNGIIIIERSKKDIIEDIPFDIVREQIYSDTVVTFIKNKHVGEG